MADYLDDIFHFYINDIVFSEDLDKSSLKNSRIELEKSTNRIVEGYASRPTWDTDGELVVKDGLDISYFVQQGWLNWMHNNSPSHIIGVPIAASIDDKGLFCKGMLLNNDMATHVWNLAVELKELGHPRKLGYSIEGKVVQRSEINKSKIVKAKVTNVAITHIPVNTDATFEAVVKSFVPPTYDQVVNHIIKDLSLKKDLAALDSPGLEVGHARDAKDSDAKAGRALVPESLEGTKNVVRNNPNDDQMDNRLFQAYKSMCDAKAEFISIIKSKHPDTDDILLDSIVDLINKAGGLNNFVSIIKNSDVLR